MGYWHDHIRVHHPGQTPQECAFTPRVCAQGARAYSRETRGESIAIGVVTGTGVKSPNGGTHVLRKSRQSLHQQQSFWK